MANFNTINAYDADCRIPDFLGIRQYGDVMNGDPRYAIEAENMDTQGGTLQPFAAAVLQDELSGEDGAPVETLMRLYRRWTDGQQEILVAAIDGTLRYKENGTWQSIDMPEGMEGQLFQSNTWSWVTYEINPDSEHASVDVLLISNAKDGMFLLRGDNWQLIPVPTRYKFGIIERYAERIWGTAVEGEPDMLVYSAPYDPLDWKEWVQKEEDIVDPEWQTTDGEPEDRAGEIRQPSWDGDAFVALKTFGSQLIAFKRTRVWRVLGTDPGEYTFKEQFGGGTNYAATIAVDAERIFLVGDKGVAVYDGNTVNPFQQEMCADIWKRLNPAAMNQSCACLWKGKYYAAVPIDGSAICNAVLIYSVVDGTWLLRTDLTVESWLGGEEHLYFTNAKAPGCIWEYKEDSWTTGEASAAAASWTTPWNNLNYQDMRKGPFRIYLTPEVQERPVDLTITLDTDKKRKTRTVRIHPLLEVEKYYHREARPVCIHIPGGGRRFRLTISAEAGQPVWRICGGVMIVADIAGE